MGVHEILHAEQAKNQKQVNAFQGQKLIHALRGCDDNAAITTNVFFINTFHGTENDLSFVNTNARWAESFVIGLYEKTSLLRCSTCHEPNTIAHLSNRFRLH